MSTAPTGTGNRIIHCAHVGVLRLPRVHARQGNGNSVNHESGPKNRPDSADASRLTRFRVVLVRPALVVPVVVRDRPGVADLVREVAAKFYGSRVSEVRPA